MVHAPVTPRDVRKQAKLTQAQMAPLMGMSLSGYRNGSRNAADQRPCGSTAARYPEGAGGSQARVDCW